MNLSLDGMSLIRLAEAQGLGFSIQESGTNHSCLTLLALELINQPLNYIAPIPICCL